MGVCYTKEKIKIKENPTEGDNGIINVNTKIKAEKIKSYNNNDYEGNKGNINEKEKEKNIKLNDINIKEQKDNVNEKLDIINIDINDRIKYCNEIKLNLENDKSEFNKINDSNYDEYMNYEIVKMKEKIIKDLEKEINNDINTIETLLGQIQNKEEMDNNKKLINENLDKLENCLNNKDTVNQAEIYIKNINEEMEKLEEKNNKLKTDYPDSKKQIEERKTRINDKFNQYKKEKEELNKILIVIKEHKNFLNNSMFLYIKDPINQPTSNEEIPKGEALLINNFIEKCEIKDEFDLYDRNFEYQAVGLPKREFMGINEIPLTKNRIITIIEFTIDNVNINYNYDDKNAKLKFDLINLKNLEIKKVHLKYKQSRKLTEGQKRQRKIYIEDEYGISKNLKGRKAVFHLIIENDMEVISFDKEIFTKVGEGEYKIEGLMPKEGKRTRVVLSKKKAKYKVSYVKKLVTKDNKNINNIELKLHYYFEEGGNKKNKIDIDKKTNPQNKIKNIDKENRQYEIKFFNIKQNFAEVKIEGILINNCSGEWACDLTEEQIEKEIPDDYKNNKEKYKEIAQEIIKKYDEEHKNDPIEIMNIVKIGKWIKNNIKYDENYKEEKPSTALDIYNKRIGVCKQFTILYNALLYSLGYQCIYVSGFAFKDDDTFKSSDAHSWSLVKIVDKWYPFDSTWGIFSGKLPVCHIFEDYFLKSNIQKTNDNLDKQDDEVFGRFIEKFE